MAEGTDWRQIAQIIADARAGMPPMEQAQWDQMIAGIEADARRSGVDLTDAGQARAAFMGASVMRAAFERSPLFALFGRQFVFQANVALSAFASFIHSEGVS